jgi:hypothetical protein
MSDIARTNESVRIGTAERERAAEALGEHLAAGRLDPDEYADRVSHAYAARTASDLEPLFRDLPSARPEPAPRARRHIDPRVIVLVLAVAACVAWVAVLRVPPFFVFPLLWVFVVLRGGRRFARRW